MADILDYIDWRGDVPFSVSPFNEVDGYIIAKIGTPDFTGIVPEDGENVSVGAAIAGYAAKYGDIQDNLGVLTSKTLAPVLNRLPETARYADLRLSGYAASFSSEVPEQFSALTVILPDETKVVTFRGTDDTLVAWKEDCLIAVERVIPAQDDAERYLLRAAEMYDGPLMVAGHSKGGNLAVYAAARMPEEIQERIVAVYNYDGPGFKPDFLQSIGYMRIMDKVHTILPKYSIVGTLLTQDSTMNCVESDSFGIASHDGFTWNTCSTGFVRCEELSRSSRVIDESMDYILAKMTRDECREFINDLFDILSSAGAVTVTDLTEQRLTDAAAIAGTLRKNPTMRKFASGLIRQILREYRESITGG